MIPEDFCPVFPEEYCDFDKNGIPGLNLYAQSAILYLSDASHTGDAMTQARMKMSKSNAVLMTAEEVQNETMWCAYDAAEAAKKLGLSETTVRRVAKDLGVKKIKGGVVAGFVVWPQAIVSVNGTMAVKLPYAR